MTQKFILLSLLAASAIHLLPLIGVLSASRLQTLYGLSITDPDLLILMRHRAVLFGLIGAFVLASVFVPSWRLPALLMATISMIAFILLTLTQGEFNAYLRRVLWVDAVVLAAAIPALALLYLETGAAS